MNVMVLAVSLLVLVLGLALFLRDRVASLIEITSVVAFVVFAAVSLSALLAPVLYETAADATLEAIGVLGRIQQLDQQLAPLARVSEVAADVDEAAGALGNILRSDSVAPLLESLGVDPDEILPAVPTATPAPEGAASLADEEPHMVQDSLYPSLVSLVAAMFRFVALAVSVPGMIAVVGLGYAASLVADAQRGRDKLADLEDRVARLESEQLEGGQL
ncbi:MAG: hypothetical protein ACK2UL_06155 [Anaerolineae bacterium]|jgi:hypothetical protein